MKILNQVCSLELSKQLKELEVEQESLWWWNRQTKEIYSTDAKIRLLDVWSSTAYYSAFTVAELGEMLPDCIKTDSRAIIDGEIRFLHISRDKQDNNHFIDYLPLDFNSEDEEESKTMVCCDTEADARAKMIIYLIENKLITNK